MVSHLSPSTSAAKHRQVSRRAAHLPTIVAATLDVVIAVGVGITESNTTSLVSVDIVTISVVISAVAAAGGVFDT
jgi:hypothetical protein